MSQDPTHKINVHAQKEPIAMLWIIIGLLVSVAAMIGIERLVERY
ncbi:MAG TPA: hypothetical protein VMZ25_02175 [Terriglobales bacterium]|nr:hypothetical protein [Terriglobales bacterium]